MLTILAGLAMLPFAVVIDWLGFIARQADYQRELTKASHGAALAIMVPLYTRFALDFRWISPSPYAWPIALAIAAFGIFWLITGSTRARAHHRDSRLMGRAAVKLGIAGVLFYITSNWPGFRDRIPEAFQRYALWILITVMLFCAITGLVKLLILLRGPPKFDTGTTIDAMPHGNAGFGRGGSLEKGSGPTVLTNVFKTKYRN